MRGRRGRKSSHTGIPSGRGVPSPSSLATPPSTPASTPSSLQQGLHGNDLMLKRELLASPTILSYSDQKGLSVVPYPCDDDGVPVPVQHLWEYNQAHHFLDNILCFCEHVYGTPRPVRMIKARMGEHAGSVCLGCPDWLAGGHDRFNNRAGCRYWINLNHKFTGNSPWARTPLQVYPERTGTYTSPTRLPSSQVNPTSFDVAARGDRVASSPESPAGQSMPPVKTEFISPSLSQDSTGTSGWGTASPTFSSPAGRSMHCALPAYSALRDTAPGLPCSQPKSGTTTVGHESDSDSSASWYIPIPQHGHASRARKRRRTLVHSAPGWVTREIERFRTISPPLLTRPSAASPTLTKASYDALQKSATTSLKRKAAYDVDAAIEISSSDDDVAVLTSRPPSAHRRPLLISRARRASKQDGPPSASRNMNTVVHAQTPSVMAPPSYNSTASVNAAASGTPSSSPSRSEDMHGRPLPVAGHPIRVDDVFNDGPPADEHTIDGRGGDHSPFDRSPVWLGRQGQHPHAAPGVEVDRYGSGFFPPYMSYAPPSYGYPYGMPMFPPRPYNSPYAHSAMPQYHTRHGPGLREYLTGPAHDLADQRHPPHSLRRGLTLDAHSHPPALYPNVETEDLHSNMWPHPRIAYPVGRAQARSGAGSSSNDTATMDAHFKEGSILQDEPEHVASATSPCLTGSTHASDGSVDAAVHGEPAFPYPLEIVAHASSETVENGPSEPL